MSFTVGIIGGGQLARMMHAASIGLGINVRLLAEAARHLGRYGRARRNGR